VGRDGHPELSADFRFNQSLPLRRMLRAISDYHSGHRTVTHVTAFPSRAVYAREKYRTLPPAMRLCWRGNMKSNGTLTKSNGSLALVQSIYDYVHLALWATLTAFVVFFLAFIAPKLPEAAARAEALRIQAISQENEGYCAKWQMGPGTKMHDQCIFDLQELRAKAQNRFADQLDF
jgi:hypothetical protein